MRKVNVCILVALFGVAAVIWGRHLAGWLRTPPNLSRYPLGPRYYCENCGWHFDESPRLIAPLKCPKCRQLTAMKTLFSPSAGAPEFMQCAKCQALVPYQLFKWPLEEKRRWEKRLSELGERQFLSVEEMNDLQKTKLVKTSAVDWMKWQDFVQLAPGRISAVRCPKCGNTDPARFSFSVPPPGAPVGR